MLLPKVPIGGTPRLLPLGTWQRMQQHLRGTEGAFKGLSCETLSISLWS